MDSSPISEYEVGHRCLRSTSQPLVEEVLESQSGSRSSGCGCLSSNMTETGTIPQSPLEVDTESDRESQAGSSQHSIVSNSNMAGVILVANGEADSEVSAGDHQDFPDIVYSRMDLIKQAQEEQGLEDDLQQFQGGQMRASTKNNYNNCWKKWALWCVDQGQDPRSLDTKRIAKYLHHVYSNGNSITHLIGLRAPLKSVVESPVSASNLSEDPLIKMFFKAARSKQSKLPRMFHEIYDVDVILLWVRSWGPTEDLSLQQLQQKTSCGDHVEDSIGPWQASMERCPCVQG